jgi:hypothetical protein
VNSDASFRGQFKVTFLPNYNVSLAEAIVPASDLSEQISTAGMKASGTGNIKFALNGALTIGTLDGANIEILERVGEENIFIFGMTAAQVEARRVAGTDMTETIAASPMLTQAIQELISGRFSPDDPYRYRELADTITRDDQFKVSADFSTPIPLSKVRSRPAGAIRRPGGRAPSTTSPMSAGSRRTVQSTNMRKRSGGCHRNEGPRSLPLQLSFAPPAYLPDCPGVSRGRPAKTCTPVRQRCVPP